MKERESIISNHPRYDIMLPALVLWYDAISLILLRCIVFPGTRNRKPYDTFLSSSSLLFLPFAFLSKALVLHGIYAPKHGSSKEEGKRKEEKKGKGRKLTGI